MRCDDIEEYLDGALTGARLAEFEEHLESCPACAAERRQQLRLDRALSAAARELPPASSRLRERIDRDVKSLVSRQRALTRWKFAAAVLIAATGIGLTVGSLLDGDGRRGEQAELPPEVEIAESPSVIEMIPEPEPVASVVFGDDANTVAVPVRAENVNATIVFVYPVFDGGTDQDRLE